MLHVVIEAHEEVAIISDDASNLISQALGPQMRVVTPVSLPFGLAPWVPDLQEAFISTRTLNIMDLCH